MLPTGPGVTMKRAGPAPAKLWAIPATCDVAHTGSTIGMCSPSGTSSTLSKVASTSPSAAMLNTVL